MTPQEQARRLRPFIEKATASLSDADASMCAQLFPQMKYDDSLIDAGARINWNGVIKVAASSLWDREQYNPDNAPNLWEDLDYKEGIRIIPEIISYAKRFAQDELGWWENEIYRSKVNDNVYTPAQYAANWELVE